jgi:predicted RNase H-like HicB family nuclease
VVIKQGEDAGFMVEVSILPGCFSQGKTRTEALKNIQ